MFIQVISSLDGGSRAGKIAGSLVINFIKNRNFRLLTSGSRDVIVTDKIIDLENYLYLQGTFNQGETIMAALTAIPGIGERTAEMLGKHGFTTIQQIAEAAVEDLLGVPGFGEIRAAIIIETVAGILLKQEGDFSGKKSKKKTKKKNKNKNKKSQKKPKKASATKKKKDSKKKKGKNKKKTKKKKGGKKKK